VKPSTNPLSISRLLTALCGAGLVTALLVWRFSSPIQAQESQKPPAQTPPPATNSTGTAGIAADPPAAPAATNTATAQASAPPQQDPAIAAAAAIQNLENANRANAAAANSTGTAGIPAGATNASAPSVGGTNAPPSSPGSTARQASDKGGPADGIELSFQGANIDVVIQWLAQTTGKSVMKKNQVQAQLTIVSSKKLPQREAIGLVYNALSLEGFSVIETSKSILIVPENQEPKLSPVLLEGSPSDIPEGRQRLVKIFPLKHSTPADLKDKVRPVLSEKAVIDTDDRSSSLIVTDYNDNLRLLEKLIKDLDVASISDSVVEIYNLKHAEAEELGTLITMVLTASAPPPSAPAMPGMPPGMQMPGGGRRGGNPGMPNMGQPNMGMPNMGGPPGTPGAPPGGGGGDANQVHIWPDKVSNRLIVLAPKSKLPDVKRLIEILDTDKPEDVAVRVIPAKHVTATDLVRDIAPLYEKMSGKSLKDMIEVSANDRANSLIVLSSESNFKSILKLVTTLDTDDATEKVVQTFVLKNADAEDVAKQLQDLNKDSNGGGNSRYYSIFYGGGNPGASKKLSVVADRRRNTLVVQGPPGAMEGVAKMVQSLDEPVTDDTLAPKIYPLKYVNAVDIEDVLNELFLKKTQQRGYYDFFYGDDQEQTADKNVGRLYGKVRITSEPYSNAIIVTANSAENLAAVEEVLKKLDVPSEAGETTFRVRLRFAKASTVANSLNILFAKNGSPPLRAPNQQQQQQQQPQPQQNQQGQSQNNNFQNSFGLSEETKEEGYFPWLGGQPDNARGADGRTSARPVSDLVGKVRVVPDLPSNSLMISANVHFFPQVLKLLEELDAPTPQVMIEARIIEVSSDFLNQLGVRWAPNGNAYSADDLDNGINPSISTTYATAFGGKSATAAAIANALRAGTLNASLNMDFLIQFLHRYTDATVLAEPQLNIGDNEIGRLFVGQKVPIATSTLTPAVGGSTAGYDYTPVGVILEVTPHINDEGQVALKIHCESATLQPGAGVGGDPIIDTRQFQTELLAKNGQTLVLGGIIQKQVNSVIRRTPFLSSIPGLGWAFKKTDKSTQEVELLVFLRPRITRTPDEAQELLEEADKKAPLIRPWRGDVLPSLLNDKAKPAPQK
jgi:type II secretion system protein D